MAGSRGKTTRRRDAWATSLLVFLVALALRGAFLAEYSRSPFFGYHGLDTHEYHEIATRWLAGTWPDYAAFTRPPLYPLFLALIYRTLGSGFMAVRCVHAVVSAATCVLVHRLGRTWFGGTAIPLGAALACALSGPLIYLDLELLPTGLDSLLLLAALLALGRAGRGLASGPLLAAGSCLALSALNRGSVLALLPVPLLWIWGVARRGWRIDTPLDARPREPAWRPVTAFLLPVAAALALVTWHNAAYDAPPLPATYAPPELPPRSTLSNLLSLRFVPIASNGAINFYLGNHWNLREVNDPNHPDHFFAYDSINDAPRRHRVFGASAGNRWLVAQTLRELSASDALRLIGWKLARLVNGVEVARNSNLYGHRDSSLVLSALLWKKGLAFPSGVLIPLALVGLWQDRGNGRRRFLLWASLAAQALFILAFFVADRYRAPLFPLLALYAAAGAAALHAAWKGPVRQRLVPYGTLLASLVACNLPVVRAEQAPGAYEHNNLGFALLEAGRVGPAVDQFEQALRINPRSVQALDALALAHKTQGRADRALALYTRALELRPDHAKTRSDLALTLFELGRSADAEREFREALRLQPDLSEVRANLATLLARTGRGEEAVGELKHALRDDPFCALAYANLAALFEAQGRREDAIMAYHALLLVDPSQVQARSRLQGLEASRAQR